MRKDLWCLDDRSYNLREVNEAGKQKMDELQEFFMSQNLSLLQKCAMLLHKSLVLGSFHITALEILYNSNPV